MLVVTAVKWQRRACMTVKVSQGGDGLGDRDLLLMMMCQAAATQVKASQCETGPGKQLIGGRCAGGIPELSLPCKSQTAWSNQRLVLQTLQRDWWACAFSGE